MTQLFKTFLLQLISIIVFGFIYWIYRDDFTLNFVIGKKKNDNIEILDCFYTSVTVQAGVGYSILNPHTNRGVLILMIQQLTMIFANILMLYFFSMYFTSPKKY